MSTARAVSLIVLLIVGAAALVADVRFGDAAFAFIALAGCIASELVYERLASPDDRRRDL